MLRLGLCVQPVCVILNMGNIMNTAGERRRSGYFVSSYSDYDRDYEDRGCFSLNFLDHLRRLQGVKEIILAPDAAEIIHRMQSSLKTLVIRDLPEDLTTLYIRFNSLEKLEVSLPSSLETLYVQSCFNLKELPDLPPTLKALHLSDSCIENLPNPLPSGLRALSLPSEKHLRVTDALLEQLAELHANGCIIHGYDTFLTLAGRNRPEAVSPAVNLDDPCLEGWVCVGRDPGGSSSAAAVVV